MEWYLHESYRIATQLVWGYQNLLIEEFNAPYPGEFGLFLKNCSDLASWHAWHIFLPRKFMLRTTHSPRNQKLYHSCKQQQELDWKIPTLTRILFFPQLSLVTSLNAHFPVALVGNTQRAHYIAHTNSKTLLLYFSIFKCWIMNATSHQPNHIAIGQHISGNVGLLVSNPDPTKKCKMRTHLFG